MGHVEKGRGKIESREQVHYDNLHPLIGCFFRRKANTTSGCHALLLGCCWFVQESKWRTTAV